MVNLKQALWSVIMLTKSTTCCSSVWWLRCVLALRHRMFTHWKEEPKVHRDSFHKIPALLSIYSYKYEKQGEWQRKKILTQNHLGPKKEAWEWWRICSLGYKTLRHELFWNLGGNREEIFGRGTSGLNSLDTPRSFLLLFYLVLLLSVSSEPKSCVLSLGRMCCVTTRKLTRFLQRQ